MINTQILYKEFLEQYDLKLVLIEENEKEPLLLDFLAKAKEQKFSKEIIIEMLEHLCRTSYYPISLLLDKLSEMENEKNINPYYVKNEEGTSPDWGIVAHNFLIFLRDHYGICSLKYFREDFYFWNRGKYFIMDEEELGSYLLRYINIREKKLKSKKISTLQKEMLVTLKSLCYVRSDCDLPFYFKSNSKSHLEADIRKVNWLTVKNGIIDIDNFILNEEIQLRSFDEHYFSMTKLNFEYDPSAGCLRWMSILKDSLEDDERINLLQEWFGYNLLNHNKCAKFMILYGLPAAGKSVILRVLSLLVGEENYSTIGLENFDTQRSFILAHLQGKLANLVFDSNDIKKANEGVLKQFVSGEPLTVERKYKHPFVMKSTAKLTIATNHELRFSDKTDSLWRRMLLLHFRKSIAIESRQNKDFVSNDWWVKSGELPGILNWALEGLIRLERRGDFLIPDSVKADVEIYRTNINATAQFITTFLEEDEKGEIPAHWLYRDYKKYCLDNGYIPQNAQNFAKELKKAIPTVKSSEKTYSKNDPKQLELVNVYTRIWLGVNYSVVFNEQEVN